MYLIYQTPQPVTEQRLDNIYSQIREAVNNLFNGVGPDYINTEMGSSW